MKRPQIIRQWDTVALVALEAEAGDLVADRAALAFLFETDDPPDLWDAGAILANWVCRMNERYVRAGRDAGTATLAHADNMRTWINHTRSLAGDLRAVYGDRLAGVLEHAAGEIEQAAAWPELRIENPPRDQKGRADLFLTVDQWAWDRVLRDEPFKALCGGNTEGIPGKDVGRTVLLTPAINALKDAGLRHMQSDEGWKMRVRRLRVLAGQEDRLIADVLDASRSGPYDRDGREIGLA